MKKYVLVASILFAAVTAFGQENKIETDRPTEAQTANVISKGTFQAELGVLKQQEEGEDFSVQHPDAVFRYGLLKGFELRLRTTLETQRYHSKNEYNYGLAPVEAGLKATLFQTKDTSFTAALFGHIGLPHLASKDHQHNKTFYRARLLFENKLTEKIKLNYNVGRGWNDDQKQQNWMYAVSPQFQLSEKWEAFVEEYGFMKHGTKPEHYVDGGFAYAISNNIKIDVDAGKGLGGEAADYFITTGVSFRL
jgi:hypothetical protein